MAVDFKGNVGVLTGSSYEQLLLANALEIAL